MLNQLHSADGMLLACSLRAVEVGWARKSVEPRNSHGHQSTSKSELIAGGRLPGGGQCKFDAKGLREMARAELA